MHVRYVFPPKVVFSFFGGVSGNFWREFEARTPMTPAIMVKNSRHKPNIRSFVNGLRIRNLCLGHADAAGKTRKPENAKTPEANMWKHENAKTRKRVNAKTGKHENAKTPWIEHVKARKRESAKTRKRGNAKKRKRENWACAQKHFEHKRYHSFGPV